MTATSDEKGGGKRRNNYCDFNRTFSFPNFQGDLEKGKKEFNHPRAVGVRERKWLSFPISAATATQQLQRREREKAVRKQVSVDLPLIVTFQSLEGGKREREKERLPKTYPSKFEFPWGGVERHKGTERGEKNSTNVIFFWEDSSVF